MDLARPWARIALWSVAVAAVALAAALAAAAYLRPEFVVELANQIMLCF
jgi:hypothetical protein